jgi:hypothetical protein
MELADGLRQGTGLAAIFTLGQVSKMDIGANGETSGDVDVHFTVEPELSGDGRFLVRANW